MYDQDKASEKSASAPIRKPEPRPDPPPKTFTAKEDDDPVVKDAYARNQAKLEQDNEKMTRGKQAGYSQSELNDIADS